MVLNNTQYYLNQEWDLQLPNELTDWIKNEFPIKEIMYRDRKFTFMSDIPIDAMEEVAQTQGTKVDQVKVMIKVLSVDPKIDDEVLAVMPSKMLMALYDKLFPKNEQTSSQPENIKDISSVPS